MPFMIGETKVIVFDEARPAMGGQYEILEGVAKGSLYRVDVIVEPNKDFPRGLLKRDNKHGDISSYTGLYPYIIGAKWIENT